MKSVGTKNYGMVRVDFETMKVIRDGRPYDLVRMFKGSGEDTSDPKEADVVLARQPITGKQFLTTVNKGEKP